MNEKIKRSQIGKARKKRNRNMLIGVGAIILFLFATNPTSKKYGKAIESDVRAVFESYYSVDFENDSLVLEDYLIALKSMQTVDRSNYIVFSTAKIYNAIPIYGVIGFVLIPKKSRLALITVTTRLMKFSEDMRKPLKE